MDESNVLELTAALEGIDALTADLIPMASSFGEITGEGIADSLQGLLSDVDRAALTGDLSAEFADELADAVRRSVAHGIAGWRDDDLAFVADWGFDLKAIATPVAIWQGAQDRMVPFAHGRWLADNIPGARRHLFEEHGHISLVANASEILSDLLDHRA
jgi:pimeloyl-ACP methyl ester carboxylesterase